MGRLYDAFPYRTKATSLRPFFELEVDSRSPSDNAVSSLEIFASGKGQNIRALIAEQEYQIALSLEL